MCINIMILRNSVIIIKKRRKMANIETVLKTQGATLRGVQRKEYKKKGISIGASKRKQWRQATKGNRKKLKAFCLVAIVLRRKGRYISCIRGNPGFEAR